jgi:hypothetical protein
MNGLSDSLTIGLVLALVFGALFFYLYSRLGQAEKRVSLTENILLDLKMATENTMMAMASASVSGPHGHDEEDHAHHEERFVPTNESKPVEKEEVEEMNDEDFYKQILEQSVAQTQQPTTATLEEATVPSTRVEANYEAMTLKELKAEAKRKGISVPNAAHKKDLIDALKRQGQTVTLLEGSDGVLEEGFPVEN